MDSSDLEEDIEQYIEKVLNEEQQEVQETRRDSERESTEEPEEDREQYIERALHEPEEQEPESTSQLEIFKELDEELIFEEAGDKPEESGQPEAQERQRDSDRKELEDLIEEHLSEDEVDEPEELGQPEKQEPQLDSDQDRGESGEERISEEKSDEPEESEKPEEQELREGSELESLGELEQERISEEKADEPEELEKPEAQEPHPGPDQEDRGELEEKQIPEQEPDGAGEGETESVPQEENLRPGKRRHKGGRRIAACVAVGLIVLIGIGAGYLYVKQDRSTVSPVQGEKPGQTVSVSIPHDEVLVLEPFVIPAEGNENFTYVFLSISMKFPNREVKREVIEKKRSLRGIVYDILAREIADTKEIPPLETLKEFIIRGANSVLSGGKISEVFVSKFLAV